MGALFSRFFGKKEPDPVKGAGERLTNIAIKHFRGILGVLVTIIALSWQLKLHDHPLTSCHLFAWMFIFYLFTPVSVQVTGMIPVFALPMFGIEKTILCVKHYWNEGASLLILGGMLNLLFNNSGFDKRVILSIICGKSLSPIMLLLRSSLAAFIMSALSHRLIVASTLIGMITPIFTDLEVATAKYKGSEANYNQLRYVINNGIQTSCSIGGLVFPHTAYCTLVFRAIFEMSVPLDQEYPNALNYLQYTAFALPLAIILFIVNFAYHAILLKITCGKAMSAARQTEIATALKKHQSKIPPRVTNHEKWTILFWVVSMAMYLGRWNEWTKTGWAEFSVGTGESIPKVRDATTAALFVILCHIIPRSYGFVKILTAKKKSELPAIKPESAVLFWRFVDKNTNYGYFYVIGGAISLWNGATVGEAGATGADKIISSFKFIRNLDFTVAILVITIVTVVLCNIMTGVAAVGIWLPLVLCLKGSDAAAVWAKSIYRPALAIGLASSIGFMSPFLYTPAYFCHHTGKVPKIAMAKYSFVACILATLIIWVLVTFYAPVIFSDFVYMAAPTSQLPYGKTAVATDAAAAGGAPAAPPADAAPAP